MSTEHSAGRACRDLVDAVDLIDHHCHGVIIENPPRAVFEDLMTESPWPSPRGTSGWDSQVGLAIRRRCAPVLDLSPDRSPEDYLARRAELGASEVNRRLLGFARLHTLLLDTGYRGDDILDVAGMAEVSGAPTHEIVRLEAVAEQVAVTLSSGADFPDAYRAALAAATVDAVGLKSIVAYRYGLDFEAARPSEDEVAARAAAWLDEIGRTGRVRLTDPVLLRFGIWCGVDRALPLQFHVGYGDADVDLVRCNPLLMTAWLKATRESGTSVMLLHCYPYHREAGYLAQVYPHVYCDVGLAINYTGARSAAVIAESLELTPFHKALFSTDTFGLPEFYYVGALLFRQGLAETLDDWIAGGHASISDAARVAELIGNANARRVYRLS
ncbi:MAG: amidohydrolase family protein [Micropruina sp.]|uniref:amidohydrolase family protein n=1 Tax=Micropruina sp. TaxID=2737536 RepID=UPI0039E62C0B